MNEPFLPVPVPRCPEHGFGALVLSVVRWGSRRGAALVARERLRVRYLPSSREG